MDFNEDDTKIFEFTEQKNEIVEKKEDKGEKFTLKNRWNKFSKKQKVLIISLLSLICIAVILGIVFLVDKNEPSQKPKLEEPKIVIENKNYRYEDGSLIILNDNKEELGKYECKNKDNEKCFVAYNSEDDLDETKYVYENGEELRTQTPIINAKYVFVYDNASNENVVIKLYNLAEKKVEETYSLVKKAINNDSYYIVANTEGAYGLIQISENGILQIIKFNYEYLGISDKSDQQLTRVIAKSNEKYFLINEKEERLTKPVNEKIVGFNNNYLKTRNADNQYSVYDYKGNKLLKENYEFIYLIDNYLGVVKDKLFYIVDSEDKYLNVEGIKLFNTYYNKTYLYDENDKMLNIKEAVNVEFKDNIISIITLNEDDEKKYEINILESILNNKLSYVSYIDGSLYFYSDEEKVNLIGSYVCKNKNEIVDENSTLQNCYLAKESYYSSNPVKDQIIGYLPLINNRYIFINDVLDITKSSIVLYDLIDKKTLGTYLSVDAGIYTGQDSLMFYDTTELNVIALSAKKNKYGMITFTKDNVLPLLDFTNNSIERLKEYYLVNRSSGTYSLMDSKKNFITKEYSYKIIDYFKKYVKVIDNNKYRLFDYNGKEITNGTYEYIAMYEDNYVAIKDNKLVVSTYDKKILIDNVELKLKDYNNAYTVDKESVTIYNEDKTYEKIYFTKDEINDKVEVGEITNGEE